MEESQTTEPIDKDFNRLSMPGQQSNEPRVRVVLLTQFGFSLGANLVATIVFLIIAAIAGWDYAVLQKVVPADAPIDQRIQMRLFMGVVHFFMFIVAGSLTVWLCYRSITRKRPDWLDYLNARRWPGLISTGTAILLMLAAIPLVLFTFEINKLIPMPAYFHAMEASAAEMTKGLLQMNSVGELLANLTIVALLPAIGEELVFRGVLQKQLMRRMAPWVAILVASTIFSLIHGQLEGFLPRLLLGGILGWLYWKSGNFWVAVIAHFFNNAFQVIGQYLYKQRVSTIDLEQDVHVPWYWGLLSALVIGVIMLLYTIWKDQTRRADSFEE